MSVLKTGAFIPMHRRIKLIKVKLFRTMQTMHCAPATPSQVAEGKGIEWGNAEPPTEDWV